MSNVHALQELCGHSKIEVGAFRRINFKMNSIKQVLIFDFVGAGAPSKTYDVQEYPTLNRIKNEQGLETFVFVNYRFQHAFAYKAMAVSAGGDTLVCYNHADKESFAASQNTRHNNTFASDLEDKGDSEVFQADSCDIICEIK